MWWNKEKDFHMMRRIASKGGNLEVGNIADNLNNCEDFAVKAQFLEITLLPS